MEGAGDSHLHASSSSPTDLMTEDSGYSDSRESVFKGDSQAEEDAAVTETSTFSGEDNIHFHEEETERGSQEDEELGQTEGYVLESGEVMEENANDRGEDAETSTFSGKDNIHFHVEETKRESQEDEELGQTEGYVLESMGSGEVMEENANQRGEYVDDEQHDGNGDAMVAEGGHDHDDVADHDVDDVNVDGDYVEGENGIEDIDEWLGQHAGQEGDAAEDNVNRQVPMAQEGTEATQEDIGRPSDQSLTTDDTYGEKEHDAKLLDVDLLEEICGEAANMTIKEALIHSLKPNVRAGITSGNFELSETEILELELYCEEFIGGLLRDVLRRSSATSTDSSDDSKLSEAEKAKRQLTGVNLLELKLNCDHFVRNIIAESIIDSSIITAKARQEQESNLESSQDLNTALADLQDSKELQEYFSKLTADIVSKALMKVSSLSLLEDDRKDEDEEEQLPSDQDHDHNNDFEEFDYELSYGLTEGSGLDYKASTTPISSLGTPDVTSDGGILTPSRADATDTSLEFDMDWVQGALHDMRNTDEDRKDKIVMRELEFDEHVNVGGSELLAPVFLAIAEENENDSEFQGMRRKAQSIEDLCGVIEERDTLRSRRTQSLNFLHETDEYKPRARSYQENLQRLTRYSFDEADTKSESTLESEDEEPVSEREYDPSGEDSENEFEPDYEAENFENSDLDEVPPDSLEYSVPEPDRSGHDSDEFSEPELVDYSGPEEEERGPGSPQYRASDENEEYRWHTVRVNKREKVLDLKLLEPYMKVITHGGFHSPERAVIVVIAACYLPDKSRKNYDFIMEQVFFYLISTLELLATTEEFFIVYFNGGTSQSNMPSLTWMKRFYQHIEGGLKKNMIHMYIVHPNLWLKTVVRFAKAFVSTNFWHKLQFVKSLRDLSAVIPIEYIYIPDEVIRTDPPYRRLHNL